jgi:hypothetical protein
MSNMKKGELHPLTDFTEKFKPTSRQEHGRLADEHSAAAQHYEDMNSGEDSGEDAPYAAHQAHHEHLAQLHSLAEAGAKVKMSKSVFSYPGQSYSDIRKSEELAKANEAPNTWFHYDHPEHGKIEVSAHVPEADESGRQGIKFIPPSKDVKIHGVGAPGDVHIDPIHDAGMSPQHMKAMKLMASKLGPGQHMK